MQFAQEVVKDIRNFNFNYGQEYLDDNLAMMLRTRFFVSDKESEEAVIASAITVVYDEYLENAKIDQEMEFETHKPVDERDPEQVIEKIGADAVIHGHEFEDMFDNYGYDELDLEKVVIDSVLFDKEGNYAGLKLVNVDTWEYKVFSPLKEELLTEVKNDKMIVDE